MAKDWFKWPSNTTSDPRFKVAALKAGEHFTTIIALWAYFMETDSEAKEFPGLATLDMEVSDYYFGLQDGTSEKVLEIFRELSLVDF